MGDPLKMGGLLTQRPKYVNKADEPALPKKPSLKGAKGTTRIHPVKPPAGGFISRQPTQRIVHRSRSSSEAETDTEIEPEVLTPRTPATGFIPPQRTQEDLDQCFSDLSEALSHSDESVSQVVPEPGPVMQATSSSLPGTFGILSKKVDDAAREQFASYRNQAETRDREKREKAQKDEEKGKEPTYKRTDRTYTKADGTEGIDIVWERREDKLGVELHAWQAAKGKQLQTGLNKVGDVVRKTTGRPRPYGQRYGRTAKGKDPLLNQTNQVPNDWTAHVVSDIRLGVESYNLGSVIHDASSDPTSAADMAAVTDAVTGLPVVPSVFEAGFALEAHLRQVSALETAKKNLRFRMPATRFAMDPENATSEDAEGYLKFMEAGERLFDPTVEDASTAKAAKDRTMRTATVAASNIIGTGIAVAEATGSVIPGVDALLAPLSIAAGVIEADEGKHELLRRVDQKAQARLRTDLMIDVLNTRDLANPEYEADNELVKGLVECFSRQQSRLVRQAEREKKFARARIFRGGGTVGAGVGAVAGVVTAAVLAAPETLGATLVVPLALGVYWTGLVATRNHKRVRADHNAKRRQRMAQAVTLVTPRDVLEHKLAGQDDDDNTVIRFTQEEGEYVPETGHFGIKPRTLELDALDNEYLGLHLLALKIQDLVRGGAYDENSPVMKLVHVLGIDKLRLLAICKAAAAKKPSEQLDFIQAKLAPKLGIKFRVGANQTQAPPHVSIFLEHFRAAAEGAFSADRTGLVPHSHQLFPEIRKRLEALYSDPQAGMQAFQQAIKTFKDLPQTDNTKHDMEMLKGFAKYLADVQAAREKSPLERFEGLVEKELSTDARREANRKKSPLGKFEGLVEKKLTVDARREANRKKSPLEKFEGLVKKDLTAIEKREASSLDLERTAQEYKVNQLIEELERLAPTKQATRA